MAPVTNNTNQRVTNATLALTLENLETNMAAGFERIGDRQEKVDGKLDKLSDRVGNMTATYAECSAIQGQRWEAHEKVHEQLRPKRDQTLIDIVLGAMVVGLGALGITTKS